MRAHRRAARQVLPGFRRRLTAAIMLLVTAVTFSGMWVAQRHLAVAADREMANRFEGSLELLARTRESRHAVLDGICRALVRKPRIHAALEDDALDLLYPSAADEMRAVTAPAVAATGPQNPALPSRFHRFLDSRGGLIRPERGAQAGDLTPEEEVRLALPRLPLERQIGYLERALPRQDEPVDEVIATPIVSSENGEVIAALVVGFPFAGLEDSGGGRVLRRGVWTAGRLHLPQLSAREQATLGRLLPGLLATPPDRFGGHRIELGGEPHLVFTRALNPGSAYPPAHEVGVYSLAELAARQARWRWQILGAGGIVLLGAFWGSHAVSRRFTVPVERLAVQSADERAHRERAEAALETTSRELQRSARFSADASHQLKTPVTVMRAGLEELLASEPLSTSARGEVEDLIRQTSRLTGLIEDLLLLARMDAGRLQIRFDAIDLPLLIESWLDDLSTLADPVDLAIEANMPPVVHVAGEKRYTSLIVQNLLENARKYNRPGGRIRIAVESDALGPAVALRVGNTGRPIPPEAQPHIFERFHRGRAGENVPGYGLGLNLARDLARFHGGELRLVCSKDDWTEFEVTFRAATASSPEATS